MNLLVVEDNPRDMQGLLNLLHGWEEQNQPLGIRAESCITADTMQAFQGYDAVLLDIETPGIDGMAFARRLRACNSRIDIIFVTCHTDLVMDGFSVHAAGFLPKPVEQKQLWETLDFLAKRSISRRADACVTFKRGTACDRYAKTETETGAAKAESKGAGKTVRTIAADHRTANDTRLPGATGRRTFPACQRTARRHLQRPACTGNENTVRIRKYQKRMDRKPEAPCRK